MNTTKYRRPERAKRPADIFIYSFIIGGLVAFVSSLLLYLFNTLAPAPILQVEPVVWITAVVLYFMTIFSVSFFTHRLGTHEAFNTKYLWMKYIVAALAAAFQGKFANWWADHHEHHAHSDISCNGKPLDQGCDPHTPRDGFWHSFADWLIKVGKRPEHPHWALAEMYLEKAAIREQNLRTELEKEQQAPFPKDDLEKQASYYERVQRLGEQVLTQSKKVRQFKNRVENRKIAQFFDSRIAFWGTVHIVVPGIICFALGSHTPASFMHGVWIAGLGRIGAVNFFTSLVNSYEHKRGFPGNYRHFETKDDSNNNLLLALFNPEAMHWGHHFHATAANHGIHWWERIFDYTANIIWIMEKLHLVTDVNWMTVAEFKKQKQERQGLTRKVSKSAS